MLSNKIHLAEIWKLYMHALNTKFMPKTKLSVSYEKYIYFKKYFHKTASFFVSEAIIFFSLNTIQPVYLSIQVILKVGYAFFQKRFRKLSRASTKTNL